MQSVGKEILKNPNHVVFHITEHKKGHSRTSEDEEEKRKCCCCNRRKFLPYAVVAATLITTAYSMVHSILSLEATVGSSEAQTNETDGNQTDLSFSANSIFRYYEKYSITIILSSPGMHFCLPIINCSMITVLFFGINKSKPALLLIWLVVEEILVSIFFITIILIVMSLGSSVDAGGKFTVFIFSCVLELLIPCVSIWIIYEHRMNLIAKDQKTETRKSTSHPMKYNNNAKV